MSERGEIKGRLVLDSDQFRAEVQAARAKLSELTSEKTDVRVTADTRAARTGLDGVTKSVNAVAAAEVRMKAAVQASDRATAVALLAQMRLKDVQEKRGRTALQVASAEEALRYATQKSDAAAVKATAAEEALQQARKGSTAAALENAAASNVESAAIDRVSRRADSGAGRIALMTSAVVAATPALFPIAGVATAGAVALGGLGAAGLLAGMGVARGLKNGSAAAEDWRPLVDGVVQDVHRLQDTAAAGLLPGAEATFGRLQRSMPMINRGIAEMARDLGDMAPTGLDAAVTLIERGVPLWRSGADWLGRMVDGLDDFAHSDAYKGFIDYSVRNGPQVERFLSHTVQLVGDIITAWGPYGEEVLPVLDDTVVTVGHLIKALGPLPPMIAAGYLAFRGYTGLRAVIDGITTGMRLLGVESVATAGKVAAAEAAAGGGGLGVRGVAGLTGAGALVAGGAVIGAHSVADDSQRPKIVGQIGKGRQAQAVSSGFNANVFGAGGAGFAFGTKFADQDKQLAALVKSGNAAKAAQMWSAMGVEAAKSGVKVSQLAAAYPEYEAAVKRTAASQSGAAAATRRTTSAVDDAIAAIAKLDAVQSKASNTAKTLEGSWDSAADAASAATKAVKDNGTSLDRNTEKGRANREAILQAVDAAQQHAASLVNAGKSGAEAAVYTDKFAISLVNSLTKMGMSRDAAEAYVKKLLGIPKNISTTAQLKKDQAEAALLRFRKEVDALDGKVVDVYVSLRQTGLDPSRAAQVAKNQGIRTDAIGGTVGGDDLRHMVKSIAGHADGATVRGPGTSSSDSVLRWLSAGEEVTSNRLGQAAANRPMLKAINTGNSDRIRRTAQEQYGAGQPDVHVHMAPKIPGYTVDELVDVKITTALSNYDRASKRTAKQGYMNKGLLAGTGS